MGISSTMMETIGLKCQKVGKQLEGKWGQASGLWLVLQMRLRVLKAAHYVITMLGNLEKYYKL